LDKLPTDKIVEPIMEDCMTKILVLLLEFGVLALLAAGLILSIRARNYRTAEAPPNFIAWNPKYWRPFWMTREWFLPQGYRLYVIGTSMIILGCVIAVVAFSFHY
jgi:hypothetical protein